MTKCDCGNEEFMVVDTTTITQFWADEYSGGFERNPNLTIKKKLICTNCGKFFKEDKYWTSKSK